MKYTRLKMTLNLSHYDGFIWPPMFKLSSFILKVVVFVKHPYRRVCLCTYNDVNKKNQYVKIIYLATYY